MATMIMERAVELWMTAMLISGPNQGLHIVANIVPCRHCRGVLGIVLGHDWETKKLRNTCIFETDAPRSMSWLVVFMHHVGILITLPFPRVTFCCVISENAVMCMQIHGCILLSLM